MATISGTVTLGASATPGAATLLLMDATCENVVATTTSAGDGSYTFAGLSGETTYYIVVLGGGVYRSEVYGPVTTGAV